MRAVRRAFDENGERGYIALATAFLATLLIGVTAFAVDVGQWYVTARQVQRAADAGALAGVPYLPGDQARAFDTARSLVTANSYTDGVADATVSTAIDSSPTRLRVTVSKRVPSLLGGIFGIDSTTIARSSVADYAGPVALGSPCNDYGNDPDPGTTRSSNCSGVDRFWGNVGSGPAAKSKGDAYQDNSGCSAAVDGCSGSVNTDYDPTGYFYTITLAQPVNNLAIEVYDPAQISVGDVCAKGNLAAAKAIPAANAAVPDPATRYAEGATSWCNGDVDMIGDQQSGGFVDKVSTNFTVRDPGTNPWDPTSFPVRTGCAGTGNYPGYSGDLSLALDSSKPAYAEVPPANTGHVAAASSSGYVAGVFRRWVRLCTIGTAPAGTYMVQVRTNGLGADVGMGHNRFSLRAFSTTNSSAKDSISVAGFTKMAMFANLGGLTSFYLARVPSGAGGQILNIRLFDVGDASQPGTITVLPPAELSDVTFDSCIGSGVEVGPLPGCKLSKVYGSNTYLGQPQNNHQGRWQGIAVQIPANYHCDDLAFTACWVRLQYNYAAGNTDTTSWTASLEGDPVRIVE